ncbi:Uncharacterised protein [Burkholderia pseudomallei]|nr:Uncharacterised protein [Burkholderia pseudomallei]
MGAIVAGPGTRYRSLRAKNRRVGRRAKAGAGGGPRSRARRQFAAARVAGSDRLRSRIRIVGFDHGFRPPAPRSRRRGNVRIRASRPRFAPFRDGVAGGRERIGHAANDTSVGSPFDTPTTAPSQPRGARLPGSGPGRDTPARRRAGALATAPRRAPNTSAVRPTAKKPRGLRDNTAFPRFSRFRPLAPRRSPRAPLPSRAASPPGRSRLTVRTS